MYTESEKFLKEKKKRLQFTTMDNLVCNTVVDVDLQSVAVLQIPKAKMFL